MMLTHKTFPIPHISRLQLAGSLSPVTGLAPGDLPAGYTGPWGSPRPSQVSLTPASAGRGDFIMTRDFDPHLLSGT